MRDDALEEIARRRSSAASARKSGGTKERQRRAVVIGIVTRKPHVDLLGLEQTPRSFVELRQIQLQLGLEDGLRVAARRFREHDRDSIPASFASQKRAGTAIAGVRFGMPVRHAKRARQLEVTVGVAWPQFDVRGQVTLCGVPLSVKRITPARVQLALRVRMVSHARQQRDRDTERQPTQV